MMRTSCVALAALTLALAACSSSKGGGGGTPAAGKPVVAIVTSLGTVEVELLPDKAPLGVKNFLAYVDKKHYDGTIFHRVIPNFMIQGGNFLPDMTPKPTDPPIKNEAGNGLLNERGTVSWARTGNPDSANSQFFINVKHNVALDHRDDTPMGIGYAVFGRVTKGLEIVDKIDNVQTGMVKGFRDVPIEPVVIQSVRRK
jgi:cyclophilin family peptidyl-prolyl cis-trans isomerase